MTDGISTQRKVTLFEASVSSLHEYPHKFHSITSGVLERLGRGGAVSLKDVTSLHHEHR